MQLFQVLPQVQKVAEAAAVMHAKGLAVVFTEKIESLAMYGPRFPLRLHSGRRRGSVSRSTATVT